MYLVGVVLGSFILSKIGRSISSWSSLIDSYAPDAVYSRPIVDNTYEDVPIYPNDIPIYSTDSTPIYSTDGTPIDDTLGYTYEEVHKAEEDESSVRSISEPIERMTSKRSRGEQATMDALYKITGKRFITVRPSFLKNPETNRNLELDCYNHELKLAVEYNGEQHYKFPNFISKTEDEWIQQARRDDFKRRSCDKHGVFLITVPYTIPNHKIEAYLRDSIARA